MNTIFHKKETAGWAREQEFTAFSQAGCGFTLTADFDATALYAAAKAHGVKFYPLLAAVTAQIVNRHEEYRYGWQDGSFGVYDEMHPLFFDRTESGNVRGLCAPYRADIFEQVAEIERVRAAYAQADCYYPQPDFPPNTVNISCLPWVQFTGLSFSLQYTATYYPPIITYGRFEERNGRRMMPMSVYCNHAVNDGWHASQLILETQQLADSLT